MGNKGFYIKPEGANGAQFTQILLSSDFHIPAADFQLYLDWKTWNNRNFRSQTESARVCKKQPDHYCCPTPSAIMCCFGYLKLPVISVIIKQACSFSHDLGIWTILTRLCTVTEQAPVGLTCGWTEQSETQSRLNSVLLFSALLCFLHLHQICQIIQGSLNVLLHWSNFLSKWTTAYI